MIEMSAGECAEELLKIENAFSDDLYMGERQTLQYAASILRKIDHGELVEVVHGEWKEYAGVDKGFHYCSKCESQAFNYEDGGSEIIEILSDYCPSCGAKMDGPDHD